MVLPEELCARLSALAEQESRTVSNMARVLIQQGVDRHEDGERRPAPRVEERLRPSFEQVQPRRMRGAQRRLKLYRPS